MIKVVVLVESGAVKRVLAEDARVEVEVVDCDGQTLEERIRAESRATLAEAELHVVWEG